MEMRIKHALKILGSQPVIPSLPLTISGCRAQCQQKVTCQTDTLLAWGKALSWDPGAYPQFVSLCSGTAKARAEVQGQMGMGTGFMLMGQNEKSEGWEAGSQT